MADIQTAGAEYNLLGQSEPVAFPQRAQTAHANKNIRLMKGTMGVKSINDKINAIGLIPTKLRTAEPKAANEADLADAR